MRFAALLETGREDFLESVAGLTDGEASAKPDPNRWSILECAEHVVLFEERHLRWIELGRSIEPQRDDNRELRLFTNIRNQFTKLDSPEALRPKGRFRCLAEVRSAFETARGRTIQLVEDRGDGLYAIGVRHPFFGPVNGAEVIQLIDGHARRHADQIRALRQPATTEPEAPPPVGARRPERSERLPAVLPATLEDLGEAVRPPEGLALRQTHLSEVDWRAAQPPAIQAEGCLLERVKLAEAEAGVIRWTDVRLVGCDLANLRVRRLCLERVEFIDCRLTGLSAAEHDWQDVLIENCDTRYANLQGGRFRHCEFVGTNWREADLREAELGGALIRHCRLERADLRGAALAGVDFRGSQVEGMLVGLNDLRGAIVDPAQAVVLALVLGLRIL